LANVTRRIGLSLGADVCWPICYEDLVRDLDLTVTVKKDKVRFEIERLTIEPFDLRQPVRYDVVLDRLTHWYSVSREWIKKAVVMDGLYVLNNPWSVQSMEKQTTYCAMMRLGLPIPTTWLLPPKEYDDSPDLQTTLNRYAKLFDLGELGKKVGFPLFMKPYDGGGWVGVTKIDGEEKLRAAYEISGKFVMHLQQGVVPYDMFVRCIGMGPQIRTVRYEPGEPLHKRYQPEENFLGAEDASVLEEMTLTINAFFGWDFNSCESLSRDGVWHPIDFANPCPDSQVTSLHVHFPWLIAAKIRWSLFCAAYKRPMRANLDWEPFFAVERRGLPWRERLRAYAAIAHERFDTVRFHEFCAKYLPDLDDRVWDYFGSDRARKAIRAKVEAVFPENEWDEFSDHFWSRIQEWRQTQPQAAGSRS
jgi:hypothetical protein